MDFYAFKAWAAFVLIALPIQAFAKNFTRPFLEKAEEKKLVLETIEKVGSGIWNQSKIFTFAVTDIACTQTLNGKHEITDGDCILTIQATAIKSHMTKVIDQNSTLTLVLKKPNREVETAQCTIHHIADVNKILGADEVFLLDSSFEYALTNCIESLGQYLAD